MEPRNGSNLLSANYPTVNHVAILLSSLECSKLEKAIVMMLQLHYSMARHAISDHEIVMLPLRM